MRLLNFEVGLDRPLFLIAGPCVIESADLAQETAGYLQELTAELGIPFIFKSSFDKANRSSIGGFHGPGLEAGLRILEAVRARLGVPVVVFSNLVGKSVNEVGGYFAQFMPIMIGPLTRGCVSSIHFCLNGQKLKIYACQIATMSNQRMYI